MRSILFAIPSPKEDTPQRMSFVKRLAKGIEELGITVHTFRVVKSPNPLAFIRQGLALRAAIRGTESAVVVAQFGNYTGLLVALFGQRPVIITFRGSDLNPEPNTNGLVRAVQHGASHLASLLADGIVCVTQELADRLFVKTRRAIIPSPTDVDLFRPAPQQECRRALGWNVDERIAVFFGGNNPGLKGIDLARDTSEELRRRRSPVTLRILEREAPISDMPVYLNAADCLLFLSRFEGSPNLVREACACNLPIVATPAGDIADVLREVTPTRLVTRDSREIADALEEICRTGSRSNGREHVGQYSTAIISRRSVEFYEDVVTRHVTQRDHPR